MKAAARVLLDAGSALDAVETGVRFVEKDARVRSVGRGGTPNLDGEMACDAALVDGTTLQAGAVGALGRYLHAVSVARQVMKRLPHVLLVGAGAERFARETGAESGQLLTPGQSRKFRDWTRANKPHCRTTAELAWAAARTLKTKGTVVYLARDVGGNLAAGTSTSGWAYRYPGRLGDSPIIGAGLYADTRYGACGCTHVGEMTIRCATARSVVLYMKMGASVTEACTEALTDLRDLKGGFLGRVMLHAMDREGHCCVAATHRMPARFRACRWREGSDGPARVPATVPVDFR